MKLKIVFEKPHPWGFKMVHLKSGPRNGDSFWKPLFSGSMLNFGGVSHPKMDLFMDFQRLLVSGRVQKATARWIPVGQLPALPTEKTKIQTSWESKGPPPSNKADYFLRETWHRGGPLRFPWKQIVSNAERQRPEKSSCPKSSRQSGQRKSTPR